MKRLVLLFVIAVAAAGCKIDVDVAVDLHQDETGDIAISIETDEEFERIYGFTNRSFENLVATRGNEIDMPFRVVENEEGNTYTASRAGLSLDELEEILSDLAPGLGRVTISMNDVRLDVDANLRPLPEADDLAPFFRVFDPAEFKDDVDVRLQLTAPGDLRATTADSTAAGTYEFQIPMDRISKNIVLATDLAPQGNGMSIPWGFVALVVAVMVGGAFLISIYSAQDAGEAPNPAAGKTEASSSSAPQTQDHVVPPAKEEPEEDGTTTPEPEATAEAAQVAGPAPPEPA